MIHTHLISPRISAAPCVVLLTLVVALLAHGGTGSSGMTFLKLGVSGRSVAMGDAMAASVSGAAATHYNPAGLLPREGAGNAELLFMHKEWIQDTRTEFLGARVSVSDPVALGFSVNTTTVSDIELRTRPGPAEGTFTSRSLPSAFPALPRLGNSKRRHHRALPLREDPRRRRLGYRYRSGDTVCHASGGPLFWRDRCQHRLHGRPAHCSLPDYRHSCAPAVPTPSPSQH